ncbi:MAG: hypothetical protein VCB78_12855 [Myxococcota bacterium]
MTSSRPVQTGVQSIEQKLTKSAHRGTRESENRHRYSASGTFCAGRRA